METKGSYKIGDWLKNKHTNQLYEVVGVYQSEDGIHTYNVKSLDNSYWTIETNYSLIQEHFDRLPLARLLYVNKITERG